MTLLFPQGGEVIAAKATLNNTSGQDQVVGLAISNITPSNTDTAATYTAHEASGGGYARISLSGASWSFTPGNPSTSSYAQQTWTFTGALTGSATIYDYFVLQSVSGAILYAEAVTSFTPAASGDTAKLTPQITWT